MKVRLLKDIREGVKFSNLGKVTDPGSIKTVVRKDGRVTRFDKGAVVWASDATAQKWIEAGYAVAE